MIASAATGDSGQAKNRAEKLAIGEVAPLLTPLEVRRKLRIAFSRKTQSEQHNCRRTSNYARSRAIARLARASRCVLIVCLIFF
jgi:hypothetical protein